MIQVGNDPEESSAARMSCIHCIQRWHSIHIDHNGYTEKILVPPIGRLSRHRGGQNARCLSSARTGIMQNIKVFIKFYIEFYIHEIFRVWSHF